MGYQVTGYYAPTHRYGTAEEFCILLESIQEAGVGVIIDWVPAHFPADDFSLAKFDGTCLFEHEDPRKGRHAEWGTLCFNYGRAEVRSFLIGSAIAWLDRFGVDGFRVDAVASMLYLDYARQEESGAQTETVEMKITRRLILSSSLIKQSMKSILMPSVLLRNQPRFRKLQSHLISVGWALILNGIWVGCMTFWVIFQHLLPNELTATIN